MDEKKQIEEMARIANFTAFDYRQGAIQSKTIYTAIAEALFNQGYCKLPMGARIILDTTDQQIVVLTEREHEIAMCHQYDVGFNFGYEKAIKETAREILSKLLNKVPMGDGHGKGFITLWLEEINELAQQYGVEVEK